MPEMLRSLDPRNVLFVALLLFTVVFFVIFIRAILRARATDPSVGLSPALLGVGALTDFLDTLGVGSFATTTSIFRQWRMVPDEKIPGTLNAGHTLPTIAEAFIYIFVFKAEMKVDSWTLIAMIIAAVAGAWLGAGFVSKWSRRKVRIGMGTALLGAAAIMLWRTVHGDHGGDLSSLQGMALVVGIVGNFVLGVLMTIGIGLYAPCLILVGLLGMNLKAAFPIMMGSCAFLMPVASARFMKAGSFDAKAVLNLFIGGVPAVLLAAFIVKSLNVTYVTWLVIAVVVYTAVNMLRSAAARSADVARAGVVAP